MADKDVGLLEGLIVDFNRKPRTEKMNTVTVKKSEPPESTEILAEAIVRIGEGFHKLKQSGLNEKAIVLLLHDATGLGKPAIRDILNALPRLAGWYCRK